MKTLLKNGTVVSGDMSVREDVLIDGEKIVKVGQTYPPILPYHFSIKFSLFCHPFLFLYLRITVTACNEQQLFMCKIYHHLNDTSIFSENIHKFF